MRVAAQKRKVAMEMDMWQERNMKSIKFFFECSAAAASGAPLPDVPVVAVTPPVDNTHTPDDSPGTVEKTSEPLADSSQPDGGLAPLAHLHGEIFYIVRECPAGATVVDIGSRLEAYNMRQVQDAIALLEAHGKVETHGFTVVCKGEAV